MDLGPLFESLVGLGPWGMFLAVVAAVTGLVLTGQLVPRNVHETAWHAWEVEKECERANTETIQETLELARTTVKLLESIRDHVDGETSGNS